jgi:predicted house-cleaning noncanonical NTP pyrophosphatase (MazG superfamily)
MHDVFEGQEAEYNHMYTSFLTDYYGMNKREKRGARNAGFVVGFVVSPLKQIFDIIDVLKSLKHLKLEHIGIVIKYLFTTSEKEKLIDLWNLIKQSAIEAYKQYQDADDFEKGAMIGTIVGEIFVDIVLGLAKSGGKIAGEVSKEVIEKQVKKSTVEFLKDTAIKNIIDSKNADELLEYLAKAFKNDEVLKLATESGEVIEAVLDDFPDDVIKQVTKLRGQRDGILKIITDLSPTDLKGYYKSIEVIDDKVRIVTKAGDTIELPKSEFSDELFEKIVKGTHNLIEDVFDAITDYDSALDAVTKLDVATMSVSDVNTVLSKVDNLPNLTNHQKALVKSKALKDSGFSNFDFWNDGAPVEAFTNMDITIQELDKPMRLFRRGSAEELTRNRGLGNWWGDKFRTVEEAREELAVLEQWGGDLSEGYWIEVPAGTKVLTGTAAPQYAKNSAGEIIYDALGNPAEFREGGAVQFWINSIDKSWVQK